MPRPPLSLKGRALRYLAGREHTRAELHAKLLRHLAEGETEADVRQALDALQAKGFIDEARAAESLLHRRAPRLGAQRLLQELRQKGAPEPVLAQAAEQLRHTELSRAREVWRKKFGHPPQDAAERARHMRFLAGRGFSADIVRRVLATDFSDTSFDQDAPAWPA